jgi:adenosylhomocysteine nucleosidase
LGDLTAAGRLASVSRLVTSPTGKAHLALYSQAEWVDMESYAWVETAHRHGIPITIVRTVLDAAREHLPTWSAVASWPGAVRLPWRALRARAEVRALGRRMLCERS